MNLLQLLQLYASFCNFSFKLSQFPIVDGDQRGKVDMILENILSQSFDTPKAMQQANAQLAVLYEAIKLAVYIDVKSENVRKCNALLLSFLSSKETNVRYLGLDLMSHIMRFPDAKYSFDIHITTITLLLRDRDVSIQRRALSLLYCICDTNNAEHIVNELMDYLSIAYYEIQDELALKIAILAEKFSKDYSWYLEIILKLLIVAGENVGDEVWYRIAQVVTNTEQIREFAARLIFSKLKESFCNEKTLKLGGYILGEYGHLIVQYDGCSPIEQFMTLHSKFKMASLPTQCLLLTSYLKMVNLFPEIKLEIIKVFQQQLRAIDSELEQRAIEYLAICQNPNEEILQAVCDEMPPFLERPNILITQLQTKFKDNNEASIAQIRNTSVEKPEKVEKSPSINLLTLDIEDETPITIDPKPFFKKLLCENSGILFEDSTLQIGLKAEYRNHIGKLAIFLGNKDPATLNNVHLSIHKVDGILNLKSVQSIPNVIPGSCQFHQLYDLECLTSFQEFPVFYLEYEKGSNPRTVLELSLPIMITKFLTPASLDSNSFMSRWQQLGNSRESQIQLNASSIVDTQYLRDRISKLNWQILEGIDTNPKNITAASVFSCTQLGKVGCLVRFESNADVFIFFYFLFILI